MPKKKILLTIKNLYIKKDVWSVFTAPFQPKTSKSSESRSSLPALPSLSSSINGDSQHKSNSTFYVSVED